MRAEGGRHRGRSRRSILVACLATPLLPLRAARRVAPAAMILPLTGPDAALGRSMARAAVLAQGADRKGITVLDGGATADTMAAAVRQALRGGCGLVLGPLHGGDVRPALAAIGERVPLVSFSNDADLVDSGAFLLGLTADQVTGPLFRYARGRGVRRVAIAGSRGRWGAQVAAAAARAARAEGLALVAGGGDALIVDRPDAPAIAAARAAGTQLLGAFPGLDLDGDALARLDGAWIAAPDPASFQTFAAAFQAANGSAPGLIAGLAYDAAGIVTAMQRAGGEDRAALLAPAGFKGVCGAVRFRDNGTADRQVAILVAERDGLRRVEGGGTDPA